MVRSTRRAFLLGLSGLCGGAALPAAGRQDRTRVVEITVERFAFTPSEFRVKAGEPIEIRLRSEDTDHGFRILGTEVNVTVPKRGRGAVSVMFTASKQGRYVFECSRLCGAGHSFMRGTIVAE